jgi:ligand-binding SRPBCC domain-containing protein
MTSLAERLIAKVESQPAKVWRHRLHGFAVEVVNKNLFGNVLVKMPSGNMIEMRQAQFEINYEKSS